MSTSEFEDSVGPRELPTRHVATLALRFTASLDVERLLCALGDYLSALRMHGQVCGREPPTVRTESTLLVTLLIPEAAGLARLHDNSHVLRFREALTAAGASHIEVAVLGPDPYSADGCACAAPPSYILYTSANSLESPVRCGACFGPIPLYRLPPIRDDEYFDVVSWQTEYLACDALELSCGVLELQARRELSRHDSRLSRAGRALCQSIEARTHRPTFYYLYRYGARDRRRDRARHCPSCGRAWLLPEPWHDRFDFRCEPCRLVSQIALDVR